MGTYSAKPEPGKNQTKETGLCRFKLLTLLEDFKVSVESSCISFSEDGNL